MVTWIIIFVIIALFRATSRALLFKNKLQMDWGLGLIPVYSHILMYEKIGERKNATIASLARLLGIGALLFVILHQQYVAEVALTHIYGLILGFYEMPDYDILWNVNSALGALALLCGLIMRLQYTKKMSMLFRASSIGMNFLGMLCPGIYEFILMKSKKYKYLMYRDTKDMSREEYQIYCSLIEE